MKKILIFFIFLFSLFFSINNNAYAYSAARCIEMLQTKELIKKHMDDATVIFHGKTISATRDRLEATFDVKRSWKGVDKGTRITVHGKEEKFSGAGIASVIPSQLGVYFRDEKPNSENLIIAYYNEKNDRLEISELCLPIESSLITDPYVKKYIAELDRLKNGGVEKKYIFIILIAIFISMYLILLKLYKKHKVNKI